MYDTNEILSLQTVEKMNQRIYIRPVLISTKTKNKTEEGTIETRFLNIEVVNITDNTLNNKHEAISSPDILQDQTTSNYSDNNFSILCPKNQNSWYYAKNKDGFVLIEKIFNNMSIWNKPVLFSSTAINICFCHNNLIVALSDGSINFIDYESGLCSLPSVVLESSVRNIEVLDDDTLIILTEDDDIIVWKFIGTKGFNVVFQKKLYLSGGKFLSAELTQELETELVSIILHFEDISVRWSERVNNWVVFDDKTPEVFVKSGNFETVAEIEKEYQKAILNFETEKFKELYYKLIDIYLKNNKERLICFVNQMLLRKRDMLRKFVDVQINELVEETLRYLEGRDNELYKEIISSDFYQQVESMQTITNCSSESEDDFNDLSDEPKSDDTKSDSLANIYLQSKNVDPSDIKMIYECLQKVDEHQEYARAIRIIPFYKIVAFFLASSIPHKEKDKLRNVYPEAYNKYVQIYNAYYAHNQVPANPQPAMIQHGYVVNNSYMMPQGYQVPSTMIHQAQLQGMQYSSYAQNYQQNVNQKVSHVVPQNVSIPQHQIHSDLHQQHTMIHQLTQSITIKYGNFKNLTHESALSAKKELAFEFKKCEKLSKDILKTYEEKIGKRSISEDELLSLRNLYKSNEILKNYITNIIKNIKGSDTDNTKTAESTHQQDLDTFQDNQEKNQELQSQNTAHQPHINTFSPQNNHMQVMSMQQNMHHQYMQQYYHMQIANQMSQYHQHQGAQLQPAPVSTQQNMWCPQPASQQQDPQINDEQESQNQDIQANDAEVTQQQFVQNDEIEASQRQDIQSSDAQAPQQENIQTENPDIRSSYQVEKVDIIGAIQLPSEDAFFNVDDEGKVENKFLYSEENQSNVVDSPSSQTKKRGRPRKDAVSDSKITSFFGKK